MKKLILSAFCVAAFAVVALAQEPQRGIDQIPGKKKPATDAKEMNHDEHNKTTDGEKKADDKHGDPVANDENKPVDLKTGDKITRGAALTGAKKVSLAKALKSPAKYSGKTVAVNGVVTRVCKMEGCWMELAPAANAKSVRIKMKDHAFFVPMNADGLTAKAEGTFEVKTLTKAEVDHFIEDGAKFKNINADGTVTEIAFIAAGVELTKK